MVNNISFSPVSSIMQPAKITGTAAGSAAEGHKSFASMLKQSIDNVNSSQLQSDVMTEKLARGEDIGLHEVMIASQKASITMQAALEVRNKVIEAYQETMRMQV